MRKIAVITGATDGLGRALAIRLSKDYDLALCGRTPEKMDSLLKELNNCRVYHSCFDIADDKERNSFCEQAIAYFNHIDVLINNAGANTRRDSVANIDLSDLRYMFELNCVSPLGMIQKIYPVMSKQQSGLIVNILSTCCLYHNQNLGSYTASKNAMESISKILLKEVKSEHIGVCNIYPGGINTHFRAVSNPAYLHADTVAKMILSCIENEDGCVHELVLRPETEDNIC